MDINELRDKYAMTQGSGMNYGDAILQGNLVKMGQDDITQTNHKIAIGGSEHNPLVKPFAGNPNVMRVGGLIEQAGLLDRWAGMETGTQKTVEEVIANLVEAGALAYSREGFQLMYGINF